ncbi:hypothetical protein VTJ83DRAFT_6829 [Remersonia thermophila]|uniref:WLM domain-containing protein n=1 Tax=Remersonia thermophila TaxID=72144 RepID=A0ABR4D6R3_9PEZI
MTSDNAPSAAQAAAAEPATLSSPDVAATPDVATTPDDKPTVDITIKFPPEKHNHTWSFPPTDTFEDLIQALSCQFPNYDWSKAKALPEKRPAGGSLKPLYTPAADSSLLLSALHLATLRILAPQTTALSILQAQRDAAVAWKARRQQMRAHQARHAARPTPTAGVAASHISTLFSSSSSPAADGEYTFQTLRPLPHLPNAQHALTLLRRLAADPGIRAVMRQHRFRVGLLTEMDPAAHTSATHEGVTRILGLNRNRGQVIELRLRTDAYDGWRDYRGVRRTLCHELTHNVHSEHDADFWRLCRQLEREVERADYWGNGGRTVGEDGEYYRPPEDERERSPDEEGMVEDHGGWFGGTYVLGGGEGGESGSGSSGSGGSGGGGETRGLSARELRARAAEMRARAEGPAKQDGGGSGGSPEEAKESTSGSKE